ncbi:MAG: entericidin A/B family lipoprotein [Alphaproteobacteria bacterium]|nr:entericidin A/B family lipoprotein [Alphaproteobacteria bacterium]
MSTIYDLRRILALPLLGLSLLALAACNTAEGFGEDVENTGEAIQKQAR